MTGTLATYIDRRTTEIAGNPSLFAFGPLVLGFVAGIELMYLTQDTQASRSLTLATLDYFGVVLFLALALEQSYFLARAIRQLRNDGPRSS